MYEGRNTIYTVDRLNIIHPNDHIHTSKYNLTELIDINGSIATMIEYIPITRMGAENASFAWKSKNLRRFSNGAVGYRDCDERLHTVPLSHRNCSCNFRKHAKVLSDDTNVDAIPPPPLSLLHQPIHLRVHTELILAPCSAE